jgi:PAS domain S-box-containing protein
MMDEARKTRRSPSLVGSEPGARYACVEAYREPGAISDTGYRSRPASAGSGIVTLNAYGMIEACSPDAAELFGYAAEALIGRHITLLMPSPSQQEQARRLMQYLCAAEPHSIGYECIGRRQDRTTFPLFFVVSVVYRNNRRVLSGLVRSLVSSHPACRGCARNEGVTV